MSEVRIELRHTKTVMRQSQDETWSYETRAKTRHECVETEPRQIRVNMCLETSRHVSGDSITACPRDCGDSLYITGVMVYFRYYG